MTNPYSMLPTPLDPTGAEAEAGVYQPASRVTLMTRMLASLKASPLRLYSWGQGNVPHRLIYLFASELERLSYAFDSSIRRAISESAFRAWAHPTLFPPRGLPTLARGFVQVSSPYPLAADELIPLGALFGAKDGRTVRSEQEVTFPAGTTSALVPVVSEVVGTRGNFNAGTVSLFLTGRSSYLVNNPATIGGGSDAESDEQMQIRFGDYVESRATGSRLSLFSAVMNTQVTNVLNPSTQERAEDAALILPWAIPGLSNEMGYGYVIADTGGGRASEAFLTAANTTLERVEAAGDSFHALPVNPWVVRPAADVLVTNPANTESVRQAINAAWTALARRCLIEDGRGRGRLVLYDVQVALSEAHPEIVAVKLTSHTADLQPPIAARLQAGEPVLNFIIGRAL